MPDHTLKSSLRQQCRAARHALSMQQHEQYAQQILQQLKQVKHYQEANTIGSYLSTDQEASTHLIHQDCWESNKSLLLPTVIDKTRMVFSEYKRDDMLIDNHWGIPEPKIDSQTSLTPLHHIDCLLIPMVGFTEQGQRLGFGGGYYDRYLQDKKTNPICIGLAYDAQKLTEIPFETWDISMNIIVTEEKTYVIE